MIIFISTLLFILGASVGSFLSVVISRLNQDKPGIFLGKSECPNCEKQLAAKDLIPLISFLSLKGKCRYCNKKISPTYFLIELTTGALFTFTYLYLLLQQSFELGILFNLNGILNFEYSILLINYLIIIALGILIAFQDFKYKEIPNLFLYLWILVCGISAFFLKNTFENVALAIGIAMLFYGGQILLSRGKWLGSGDLLFGIGMALLLGLEKSIVGLVFAYLSGSIFAIILIATKHLNRKSTIPFLPFLVFGTLISLFFGKDILMWYMNSNFF